MYAFIRERGTGFSQDARFDRIETPYDRYFRYPCANKVLEAWFELTCGLNGYRVGPGFECRVRLSRWDHCNELYTYKYYFVECCRTSEHAGCKHSRRGSLENLQSFILGGRWF